MGCCAWFGASWELTATLISIGRIFIAFSGRGVSSFVPQLNFAYINNCNISKMSRPQQLSFNALLSLLQLTFFTWLLLGMHNRRGAPT